MERHEKKIFTVVVEERQRYEIEVEAYDARGARGQVEDRKVGVSNPQGSEWRLVGMPEMVVTEAYEAKPAENLDVRFPADGLEKQYGVKGFVFRQSATPPKIKPKP